MTAFKSTTRERSVEYSVRAANINNQNEYIITVYHHDTSIKAEIVEGINNALQATRRIASEYNCAYTFSEFPSVNHSE